MDKILLVVAGAIATTLFAYFGHTLITSYGAARYEAGLMAGRAMAAAQIQSINDSQQEAARDAQARLTEAERTHGREDARIAALIQQSIDEENDHEKGRTATVACLDADRVRSIEKVRNALFPMAGAAPGSEPGSLSPAAAASGP